MSHVLLYLFSFVAQAILSLRYRVKRVGWPPATPRRGVLILPNHPAEMDPLLLSVAVWRTHAPHAVMVEDFYHMPALGWFFRFIGAVPMPNMDSGIGSYKRLRVRKSLDAVLALLDRGENVLLYPAGRLMHAPHEDLGGASAVAELLAKRPDLPILLVRTRGLLGSSFSYVAQQRRPDLMECLRHGAGRLLENLLLFTPRRPVQLTFAAAPADMPRKADKLTLNRWLEKWYNQDGDEPLTRVSYSRWRPVYWELTEAAKSEAPADALPVSDELRAKVQGALRRITQRPDAQVTDTQTLARDLGMDSLAVADLVAWLEEEFLASDVEPAELVTVRDVLAAAAGAVRHEAVEQAPPPPKGWLDATPRPPVAAPDPTLPVGVNFLRACDRFGHTVAVADEVSGVLSYRRLKVAVLALADVFRHYPEPRLGILLPAGVGADVVIFAALVANKVPVMINWTLGDANLTHVLKLSEVKRVITSERFLDRLDTLNVDLLGPYLVPLESLRRHELGWRRKLGALWRSRQSADTLAATFGCASAKADTDAAVLLFTSGSESVPKAVPLTHKNVQANIAGVLAALHVQDFVLYGFLPPFHSFGFTITSLLPVLSGLKVAYYPNPTESRRLASGVARWQPTVLCGTPTFIRGIYGAARPGQLRSVKLVVVGAEKPPPELLDSTKALGAELLEGYGITETSPVLTLRGPGEGGSGVGKPVGNNQLLIVDVETRQPVATGARGLILARGDSVFGGYLGRDSSDAFAEVDGHKWYITGDLGTVDAEGRLTIVGRLKRFIKIGGEMISLPAMEEAILRAFPGPAGEVRAALTAVELPSGARPVLALFAAFPLTTDAVNDALRQAGFSNLARIQQVIPLSPIPLLGTGKTDYRTLTTTLKTQLGLKA